MYGRVVIPTVTLNGTGGNEFRGYMIQARAPGLSEEALGMFTTLNSTTTQTLQCSGPAVSVDYNHPQSQRLARQGLCHAGPLFEIFHCMG
jgi:hypothetical protein